MNLFNITKYNESGGTNKQICLSFNKLKQIDAQSDYFI